MSTLYYIHDPMCSWCWAFRPVWDSVRKQLPKSTTTHYLLGGLAPDSDQPMPPEMQSYIQQTWRRIQETVPGTSFNYDFWQKCQPRRSTWPACRAVLAAKKQGDYEAQMIDAIQNTYYLSAKNPSDEITLITLASDLGLDAAKFSHDLKSHDMQQALEKEIKYYEWLSQQTGVRGFPSLVLQTQEKLLAVPRSYTSSQTILDFIGDHCV